MPDKVVGQRDFLFRAEDTEPPDLATVFRRMQDFTRISVFHNTDWLSIIDTTSLSTQLAEEVKELRARRNAFEKLRSETWAELSKINRQLAIGASISERNELESRQKELKEGVKELNERDEEITLSMSRLEAKVSAYRNEERLKKLAKHIMAHYNALRKVGFERESAERIAAVTAPAEMFSNNVLTNPLEKLIKRF